MTLEMLMQDNYDQGVADAEARAEAKAQKEIAKAQAKAKEKEACNIRNMYADNVPVAKIGQYFSLSEDEVRSIISAK